MAALDLHYFLRNARADLTSAANHLAEAHKLARGMADSPLHYNPEDSLYRLRRLASDIGESIAAIETESE